MYFKCENIQDQNLIYDMICCNIKEEEKLQKTLEIDVEERKNIIKYKKQKNRQRVKSYNKYLLQEYAI